METVIEMIQISIKHTIPQKYLLTAAGWGILLFLVTMQILIIVTQTITIITELLEPQYVRRLKRSKRANILVSASLLLMAVIDTAAICYVCSCIKI